MGRRHRRGAAAIALGAAVFMGGAGTCLAATPRQTAGLTFTAQTPGAPTGQTFTAEFQNPENPDQKPHAVARIVDHYPAGTVFDLNAAPHCTASDAELQVEGAAACPS